MHRGGEPSLTDSIGCPIVTQESQHSRTFHNVVTDDFYQKIEQNENINTVHVYMQDLVYIYYNVLGECPLPGKCPCTTFQGVNVAASYPTYT